MALYDVTDKNGVTKVEMAGGFKYHFAIEVIETDTATNSFTRTPLGESEKEYVQFSNISNKLGATTVEAYIDALCYQGNYNKPLGGGASVDAFGRLRTSEPATRLDVEFIYDKQAPFFDEITTNGTVTHNANSRDLTLSISDANDGTQAIMQSHPCIYTPGNSQLIDATGVLDLSNIGGGVAQVFLRSTVTGSTVETTIDQENWLSLRSGVDWSLSHIFSIDFQSLKVGRIQYYLVQDGVFVKVAEIDNDNTVNTGYWQLPTLPLSYRLYNDATYTYMEICYGDEFNAVGFRYRITANASATMRAICCTVKSEGGKELSDLAGIPRSVDIGTTPITVSTTLIPLLSIRPKSTFKSLLNLGVYLPKIINISTNNPIQVIVIHQGTLTGASWVDVDTNESGMEYDITASAISGGHEMWSDYLETTRRNEGSNAQGLLGKAVLWHRRGAAPTGIFSICAVRTNTTDAEVFVSQIWDELR